MKTKIVLTLLLDEKQPFIVKMKHPDGKLELQSSYPAEFKQLDFILPHGRGYLLSVEEVICPWWKEDGV